MYAHLSESIIDRPQYRLTKIMEQLNELHQQKGRLYRMKSAQLSNERIRLARLLLERLEVIEKQTGCFLIKPISTIKPMNKYVHFIKPLLYYLQILKKKRQK